jgi:hypothetical protein
VTQTRDLPLYDFEVDILTELLAAHATVAATPVTTSTPRGSTVRRLVPVAAAAVAAGAVVIAVTATGTDVGSRTGAPSSVPSRPRPIATVRTRAILAIDATAGDIFHTRTVETPGAGPSCVQDVWTSPAEPVVGELERERSLVVCDGRLHQDVEMIVTAAAIPPGPNPPLLSEGPDGSPLMNGQPATTTGEYTGVDGETHTWWHLSSTRMTRPLPAQTAQSVRADLAAGAYTPEGHATIDGHDTLVLRRGIGNSAADTIWVDATTFLPVRSEFATAASTTLMTTDYEFLPPTEANLALLAPVVPPGYPKVDGPPVDTQG